MKKTIFSLVAVLGLMGFVTQAEEAFADNQVADFVLNNFGDKMKSVSTVTTIAEIDVQNLTVFQKQDATNSFRISFDVLNGGKEAQGGLVYGVELIRRNEAKQQEIVFLDAQYFSDASFSIAGGVSLKKEFEYTASDFLTGEAELWVNIKNASGMEMSSGVEKVQLNGSGHYLELGNPCFFTVGTEQKKYNLAVGVDVEKNEQLFLNCQATNKASQNLNFDLEQIIHERSLVGEKKSSIAGDKLSFSPGESRLLKMEIKKPENPQAYDVSFRAKNEKGEASNLVVGHFVLSGQSGSINLVNLDKDSYKKGEVAKLALFLSDSADNFVGSRRRGSTLDKPSIKIQFKRSDGKKCSADFEKKLVLGGDAENISVPIIEDCFDFYVISQLFNGSQLLDERKMFFDRKDNGAANIEAEKDKNSSLTGKETWVWVLSLLIGLSFLIFILRKFLLKKKTFLLFLVILGSGFILGNSNSANAGTYELKNCYLLNKANAEAANANLEPTLSNCDTSGLSCNSSRCYVDRAYVYDWYISVWNSGCNSSYFNSEQKSLCKQLANGLVGCPFFTKFGYACATNADLNNSYSSFYDQFIEYGCFCDRANFTFSLDKTQYARGENIKITGNTAAVSTCDNGITTGIKYDRDSAFAPIRQFEWLVGANGPVTFSAEGQTSTQYVKNEPIATKTSLGTHYVFFKFSFEHGQDQVLFDNKMEYGGAVGSKTLPYTVVDSFSLSLTANPGSGPAPLTSDLTATVSGDDTFIYSAHSCGEGSIVPSEINGNKFRCTYPSSGTYHSSISATAVSSGEKKSASTVVTVSPAPCTADCSNASNVCKDTVYTSLNDCGTCTGTMSPDKFCDDPDCSNLCGMQNKICRPVCGFDCSSVDCGKKDCGPCNSGTWKEVVP
jgi:hypothetical protein